MISLAPSTTELAFAVGAGARVVGVTASCDFPVAARALPRVGAYNSPSVEVVLSLAPDMVLVPQEGALLGPVAALRRQGMRVAPVEVTGLADLVRACEEVGALLGEPERGRALARSLERRIARVQAQVGNRARPRTLFVVDHRPTVAAGEGTFADALLAAAGATNALTQTVSAWPQLSHEAIAALDPEVIVDTSMADVPREARARDQAALWARLGTVRAVREGRVISIEPDLLIRPGPRLVDGLEALARALHPDAFEALDPAGN